MTKLLVKMLHLAYSHAGPTALTSILGSTYFIPGLCNLLKKVSRSCASCQRAYAKTLQCQMGMLPPSRTKPAPPLDRTGVDFAGPFVIRQGHTRKPVLLKTYACVFVCLTTKAVHLDLCSSLSTEDFLAVLKRFVAKRGCPSHIYSDNGTNFQGAREEIRELQTMTESLMTKQAISHFTSAYSIVWHHIPPRAPHFGGLWEAAVRSMKTLLRKIVKPHPLRFDEIYTVLTEVESILNSQPLMSLLAGDQIEGQYLTAGHFLIGRPLRAAPDSRAPSGNIANRRWNLFKRATADIWAQWLGSYLTSCAQRSKWNKPSRPLQPGDVVFVKDDTLKLRDWPVAVISKTHADGQVRAVELQCRGQTYSRAVNRVILLPAEDTTFAPPPWTPHFRHS